MAISRTNSYIASQSATAPVITWTNATLTTDVLIAFVLHNHAATSTTVTAPTAGAAEPTWNKLTDVNILANTAQSCSISTWWATGFAITAGHASTWTLGTVSRDSVTWGLQLAGADTVSPADQQAGNQSNVTSTAWDSGTSATTAQADEYFLGVAGLSNNGAAENLGAFGTQVPTGWSAVVTAHKSPNATATQGLTMYGWENIVSATSAPHLAATAATSALWAGKILTLKAAAVAAVPPKRFYFPSKARRLPQPRNRSRIAWR